ncbi:serine hydrolase domain-containing protein [Alteromonas gracilis]|uniref:serine hydrolase domain-containing protein n=1 Tax=Alteromonas gracilis TaxID=1479524 RepID=UPI0030D395A8
MSKAAKITLVLLPAILWVPVALFLSFEGVWMTPVAEPNDHNEFMAYAKMAVSDNLKGNGALILLEEGKVVGRHYHNAAANNANNANNESTALTVNGDTLFPAASMSKLIAAVSIHTLAQQEKISVNSAVERYIKRWKLPESAFDHEQVTIARLLSHTAGLTDGLGFGDYTEDESVPGLIETLNNPRSSNDEKQVAVGLSPGTEFKYSGGSYLLLELLVEDITGDRYESWVTHNILKPRGLARSNFNFIASSENSTPIYDSAGQQVAAFQYASSAATALNTSANDLVALLQSIIAEPQLVNALSTPMATVMGAPIWGQGAMLYAPLSDGQFVIGHDGSNDPAINTSIRVNPITGDGYIALFSGHKTLASEIGFEWVLWQSGKPDFIFSNKAINASVIPILVGSLGWIILMVVYLRVSKKAKRK